MLKTLLFAIIIIAISVVLLCIKVIFVKGGRFPITHIEGNKALRKRGIYCAKTEDRLQMKRRGLYERMKEL